MGRETLTTASRGMTAKRTCEEVELGDLQRSPPLVGLIPTPSLSKMEAENEVHR